MAVTWQILVRPTGSCWLVWVVNFLTNPRLNLIMLLRDSYGSNLNMAVGAEKGRRGEKVRELCCNCNRLQIWNMLLTLRYWQGIPDIPRRIHHC